MRTQRALCLLTTMSVPLLLSLTPATAGAQEATGAVEGEFAVQTFEPAMGPRNYLSVAGARTDGEWAFSMGVMFNYAHLPFVVRSCKSQENCDEKNATQIEDVGVIRDYFAWDVMASLTPFPRLQIGLRVPLAYVKGDGIDTTDGSSANEPLSAFGVGDPVLEGKVRLWGDSTSPYVIGAALDLSAPLGHVTSENSYIGNFNGSLPMTIGLKGIFDGAVGPLSFGLNVKGIYRPEARLGSTTLGPFEFRYGVGAGYQISPIFRVLAEGYGSTKFSTKNGTNTLEVDGAIQISPLNLGMHFTAGGGAGIIEGVGVPQWRVLGGVSFVYEVGDKDGDGMNDNEDQCPTDKEDVDKFEDTDGCPEDDNDQDKILDDVDKCPLEPEVLNGLKDTDGCPDAVPDADKDGVPDADDKCPDKFGKVRTKEWYGCADTDQDGVPDPIDKCIDGKEDTDGFEDTDGCPDPDNDNDGILDDADECLLVPEIKNGFKDEDGCPDEVPDTDKDGISDTKDKCPKVPENINGIEDDDGCPDKGPALVQITEGEIKILQKVEFATGSDKITGAVSFAVLDAVTSVLRIRPEILQVEVAGHTDNVGNEKQNIDLSQKRAEAVVNYLATKGSIDRGRLVAKGYGPSKAIADNKTNAGRQKNRRVEFIILRNALKEAPPGSTDAAPAPPK
jgi:OmpA-OmpF porin, OOP family